MTCSHNPTSEDDPTPEDKDKDAKKEEGTPPPLNLTAFIHEMQGKVIKMEFDTNSKSPPFNEWYNPDAFSAFPMPGNATNPYLVNNPSSHPYANNMYAPPVPLLPEVVTMDDLSVGLDVEHQIIVLQMNSFDTRTFPYAPILQLNALGAIQLMQMLRAHIKRIEMLPPLKSSQSPTSQMDNPLP